MQTLFLNQSVSIAHELSYKNLASELLTHILVTGKYWVAAVRDKAVQGCTVDDWYWASSGKPIMSSMWYTNEPSCSIQEVVARILITDEYKPVLKDMGPDRRFGVICQYQ